jgi:3-phenylpropionate/trans-cinnamate dioxygenase ferredoxin component
MPNWIVVCGIDDVDREDVIPVEHGGCQYAIYRAPDDTYFASDGTCTHEHAMLADGLLMGYIIECPKHNGRFDIRSGEGQGAPIRVELKMYATKVENNMVSIDID